MVTWANQQIYRGIGSVITLLIYLILKTKGTVLLDFLAHCCKNCGTGGIITNSTILKTVKVIVNFSDDTTVEFPYIVELIYSPTITFQIVWNEDKYGQGCVESIQIVDGSIEYNISIPDNFVLKNESMLTITYPNSIFIETAKETNVVTISFCMDELPINLDNFIQQIISEIDYAHHPVIRSVIPGMYTQLEDDPDAR